MDFILELDRALFLSINNNLNNPFLDYLFSFFNLMGNWWFLAPVAIGGIYLYDKENFKWNFILLLISAVVSGIVLHFFKWLFERARPLGEFESLIEQGKVIIYVLGERLKGSNSFPSGHTQTAFTVATYFYYLFNKDKNFFVLVYLCAILVGLARIYSGVHFPLDVIAGAFVGITGTVLVLENRQKIEGR